MKKRLRKKLRLREFQEMGFYILFKMTDNNAQEANQDFLNSMIYFAEANGLFLAGNFISFFVAAAPRRSVTEAQRLLLADWLMQQPTITAVQVLPLSDAWYIKDED